MEPIVKIFGVTVIVSRFSLKRTAGNQVTEVSEYAEFKSDNDFTNFYKLDCVH